eukprot:10023629-Lingulodinium_polyedra.AAC.1
MHATDSNVPEVTRELTFIPINVKLGVVRASPGHAAGRARVGPARRQPMLIDTRGDSREAR